MKGRRVEDETKLQITKYKLQITNKKTVISHWLFVIDELGDKVRRFNVRLKASIPFLYTNSNELYNIKRLAAFPVGSVHLKKPSVGPKGLIGPPCHGAPGRRRQKIGVKK
jgi:hypothetical protein